MPSDRPVANVSGLRNSGRPTRRILDRQDSATSEFRIGKKLKAVRYESPPHFYSSPHAVRHLTGRYPPNVDLAFHLSSYLSRRRERLRFEFAGVPPPKVSPACRGSEYGVFFVRDSHSRRICQGQMESVRCSAPAQLASKSEPGIPKESIAPAAASLGSDASRWASIFLTASRRFGSKTCAYRGTIRVDE